MPPPAEPKLIFPGFAFAYAISSASVFTGSDGCTASTSGTLTTVVMSARSFFGS